MKHPEVNFFLERGEDAAPAKAVCAGCLVREECAEAGRRERFGLWGGISYGERRAIRSAARRTAA